MRTVSDGWARYSARTTAHGATKRARLLTDASDRFNRHVPDNPAYEEVTINGVTRHITILHGSDKTQKKIHALPGEDLPHGGYVVYNDKTWLITEYDPAHPIYVSALMEECNYQLKWIDNTGTLISKWCIVVDGTKYLVGENRKEMLTVGDGRMAITVPKDDDTEKLERGRRFLIDDPDASETLAFQITKSNRFFNRYGDSGVYRYIMNECDLTDNDNTDLMVADYYNWSPNNDVDTVHVNPNTSLSSIVSAANNQAEPSDNKAVWL